MPAGDYGVEADGRLVGVVERKSLADLVSSLTIGKLRHQAAELASLPRAAIVVEDRYSQIFALTFVRPLVVAEGLAEMQVRVPTVPVVFAETRKLAQEWTYRFLGASLTQAAQDRGGAAALTALPSAGPLPGREPSTAAIRVWAQDAGLSVCLTVAASPPMSVRPMTRPTAPLPSPPRHVALPGSAVTSAPSLAQPSVCMWARRASPRGDRR